MSKIYGCSSLCAPSFLAAVGTIVSSSTNRGKEASGGGISAKTTSRLRFRVRETRHPRFVSGRAD